MTGKSETRGEIAIRLKFIRLKPGYWIILDEEKGMEPKTTTSRAKKRQNESSNVECLGRK